MSAGYFLPQCSLKIHKCHAVQLVMGAAVALLAKITTTKKGIKPSSHVMSTVREGSSQAHTDKGEFR